MSSTSAHTGAAITVLTITARFPNLVQPWLVNQLIEIIRNGGDNRLLATNADRDVVPDNVREYGLAERCEYVPVERGAQARSLLGALGQRQGRRAVLRGLGRLPRVFGSRHLTIREKFGALLLLPFLGIEGIDAVHSHSEIMGSRLMAVIVALNVPLVITFHGLPPAGVEPIAPEVRQRFTALAEVILLNTQFARQQYVSLGAPEEKIRILPQGLRLGDFPFQARSLPDDGPMEVLSVGRFHPDKGQEFTISAIRQLQDRARNVVLHLVGNGPERPKLEALASETGVADRVHFYSKLSDAELRGLYQRAHVFVLASVKSRDRFHEETQGVVLQEAQASGLITIATATGGIPECIDDGVSGFLVADRSAQAIADALEHVLVHPQQWSAWQQAGREWVEQRFSVEVIGQQTWQIYQSLLAERRPGRSR